MNRGTEGPAAYSHDHAREGFSAYLEDELGADAKARMESHLHGCLTCRTELEQLRRTLGSLSGLRARAPKTFLSDVQAQIHRRSRGRFFSKRWLLFGRIPFEWISLALIIAMLVYFIVAEQGPLGR